MLDIWQKEAEQVQGHAKFIKRWAARRGFGSLLPHYACLNIQDLQQHQETIGLHQTVLLPEAHLFYEDIENLDRDPLPGILQVILKDRTGELEGYVRATCIHPEAGQARLIDSIARLPNGGNIEWITLNNGYVPQGWDENDPRLNACGILCDRPYLVGFDHPRFRIKKEKNSLAERLHALVPDFSTPELVPVRY